MIAYKGFTSKLTGHGGYQFKAGETVEETRSKTVSGGFHCTENPFECLTYFSLGRGNRYFQVEASGDIDEDGSERIACTKMTLLKELTLKELAGYGMIYMIQHPLRKNWEQQKSHLTVAKNEAAAVTGEDIAISRGPEPKVKGKIGSILGLIIEPEEGNITGAKLFVCKKEDTWYTLRAGRKLEEVE